MHHAHESPPVMLVPLYVLAVGALLAGMVFKDLLRRDHDERVLGHALFTVRRRTTSRRVPPCAAWVKLVAVRGHAAGPCAAWLFYIRSPDLPGKLAEQHQGLYQFLLNKWYFDELYDLIFVRPAKWLGRFFWKQGDGWSSTASAPTASPRGCSTSPTVSWLQTGYVYHYAFVMLIGLVR
jgi:NADH-quinone oxidoreductase subunit L